MLTGDGALENHIRTLARRVQTLEHERTALKSSMTALEKRQMVIEKKFDALDTSVKRQAEPVEAHKGRRR